MSGGLDSYTAAAVAQARRLRALRADAFDYGQRHVAELEAARAVAAALGVVAASRARRRSRRHRRLGADVATAPVPKDRALDADGIPSTYVPARNTIFLSLALGWAEVLGASDIVIGVNALDYSGYPDCRPEFIARLRAAGRARHQGRRRGPARSRSTRRCMSLTKADIIRTGLALGLDYGLTHSCYDPAPDGRPCGRCDSCVLRARGFHGGGGSGSVADDERLTQRDQDAAGSTSGTKARNVQIPTPAHHEVLKGTKLTKLEASSGGQSHDFSGWAIRKPSNETTVR